MTHTFSGACARTHTHSVTSSSFLSPLLGESDEARSNANWVKCSGKWLFPMGLLNSGSELALSRCVFVCVHATLLALTFMGVWKQIVANVLYLCAWKCVCLDVYVCVCSILPGCYRLQIIFHVILGWQEKVRIKPDSGGNWGHLSVRPHQLAARMAWLVANLTISIDWEKTTAGREGEKEMKNCREVFLVEGDVGRFTEYYLIFVREGSQFLRDPLANDLIFSYLAVWWNDQELSIVTLVRPSVFHNIIQWQNKVLFTYARCPCDTQKPHLNVFCLN